MTYYLKVCAVLVAAAVLGLTIALAAVHHAERTCEARGEHRETHGKRSVCVAN